MHNRIMTVLWLVGSALFSACQPALMRHNLNVLTGDDFEAVDTSGLIVDENSGKVK